MNLDYFAIAITLIMAFSTGIYFIRYYHKQDPEVFIPAVAWLRAIIYFCFCYLMAWGSGALEAALSQPIATPEQLADPIWRSSVLALIVLVTVGYWVIWARFTIRFDRKIDLLPQIVFGLLWGPAAGFLFLSIWHFVAGIFSGLPVWGIWIISYLLISIWQWLWQDYGWDVYISPEHDCPWSIKVKVPATHIPNVTFCLIFFALYKNYWVFIGLQTWALIGASVAMRMPSPWCKEATPAARRVPGLFGAARARASGYNTMDPANDPYVKSTGLPAATAIWVLGAHLFTMLCPAILITMVQRQYPYLETVMYAPWLLYIGAALMMVSAAFEIAQNSFRHEWYFERGTLGFLNSVYGSLNCFAMATMVTACYGNYLWISISAYLLALIYPLLWMAGKRHGIPRGMLGVSLLVCMYYTLGDPVVFLSLIGVFATTYFFSLLVKTHAQVFHGFFAAVSAFGMLSIPMAIYNSARNTAMDAWLIFAFTGALIIAGVLLWPRLSRLEATPQIYS